jgi:hypothetical protein
LLARRMAQSSPTTAAAGWSHLMRMSRGELAAKSCRRPDRSEGDGKRVSARAATEPVAPTTTVEARAIQAMERVDEVVADGPERGRNHHQETVSAASSNMVLVKWTHCFDEDGAQSSLRDKEKRGPDGGFADAAAAGIGLEDPSDHTDDEESADGGELAMNELDDGGDAGVDRDDFAVAEGPVIPAASS